VLLQLQNQSSVRVYRNGGQTITRNVTTKIQFNAEDWDIQAEFDSTTNHRYTAKVAGKYSVTAVAGNMQTSVAGNFQTISIYKNGSAHSVVSIVPQNTSSQDLLIADSVNLAVTDYVEIFVYVGGAGSFNLSGIITDTYLSIIKIA